MAAIAVFKTRVTSWVAFSISLCVPALPIFCAYWTACSLPHHYCKMAASSVMYRVRPYVNLEGAISTPEIMYRMAPVVPVGGVKPQDELLLKQLESRQETLLRQLDSLIAEASSVSSGTGKTSTVLNEFLQADCPTDLVIRVSPKQPPRWLSFVKRQLEEQQISAWWKFHTHSSATVSPVSSEVFPTSVPHRDRHVYKLIVTVIWSNEMRCPSLHTNPSTRTSICGETNIMRFFARLLGVYDATPDSTEDVLMDLCLDACDTLTSSLTSNQEKASALKSINFAIEKGSWFVGDALSLGGAFLTSILSNYGVGNIPQDSLKRWVRKNSSQLKF